MCSGAAAGVTGGGVYIAVAAGATVGAVSAAGDLILTPLYLRGQLLFPAAPEPQAQYPANVSGYCGCGLVGSKSPARIIESMDRQQCGWYSKRSC